MFPKRMAAFIVLGLILGLHFNGHAWADCHVHYDEALHLLHSTQEKISKDEHPNPDAFSKDFQVIVERLQTEKCTPELKKLVNDLDKEQKKLPLPSGKKQPAMPILD